MSDVKVAHTGLLAHLKTLPLAQAVTVGEMMALIEIVNHNAYKSTEAYNEILGELREQKEINQKLINLSASFNDVAERLANIIDVIDDDIDVIYEDFNKVNANDGVYYVRGSQAKAIAAELEFEESRPLCCPAIMCAPYGGGVANSGEITMEITPCDFDISKLLEILAPQVETVDITEGIHSIFDAPIGSYTFVDLSNGDKSKYFFS